MYSPTITKAHEETKTRQSTREILSSISPVQVYYNFGRTSILNHEKINQSPWQNTELCQSHCQLNIQRFLLSLQQFFLADVLPRQTEKL